MRLSIELQTLVVTTKVSIIFVAGKTIPVDVVFTDGGEPCELSNPGATGEITLKTAYGLAAGGPGTSWTKNGSGASAVYSFLFTTNTTQVEALFASQCNPVQAFLTIDWQNSPYDAESQLIPCEIQQANMTGTEGAPSPAVPISHFLMSSPSHVWIIAIGDDGELTQNSIS